MARRGLWQELAVLLARYPPEDWRALIAQLNDERRRSEVIKAIAAMMPLARTRTEVKASGARRGGIASLLEELQKTEPEKAELLLSMKARMERKELLPAADLLREVAAIAGLKDDLPPKRDQAISQLLRHLATLPHEQLLRVLAQPLRGRRDLAEEYEKWVSLIVDRKTRRT